MKYSPLIFISSTLFKPKIADSRIVENERRASPPRRTTASASLPAVPLPEKKLTLLATHLGELKKTASVTNYALFLWGTIVILGAFAGSLDKADFCLIPVILIINSSWNSSTTHRLQWKINHSKTGSYLVWIRLASATAVVVLSLIKLILHPKPRIGNTDNRNIKLSLVIFYALALAGELLFLLEKACWEWKVSRGRLFESVNKECGFKGSVSILIERYFYYAYSKCINGSIFDELNTNMVSFGMELILGSNSTDEQRIGAGILRNLGTSSRFSQDTLHMISINAAAMERLVDMLRWKDETIRSSASQVLFKLASEKQHSLRIQGALKSIASLLSDDNYGLNQMGLDILKEVARDDHDVCRNIGNANGLLRQIIDLIHVEESLLRRAIPTPSQVVRVETALEVLKMLVSVSGASGKQLRKQIFYTISYLRDILKHGENHPQLQILGIEILASLAREEGAAERIGGTGSVVKVLFGIFFNDEIPENHSHVRVAAGEALAVLVLERENMCNRILKLKQNGRLIKALNVPLLRVKAATILSNLCAYSGQHFNDRQLTDLSVASQTIVEAIMTEEEDDKLQEVMIGAGSCVLKLMKPHESNIMFQRAGVRESDLANRLFLILKKYKKNPSLKVPSIRRYTIELAIWMMRDDTSNARIFKNLGMERVLESVMGTTSEIESFTTFSGNVGVGRHKVAIFTCRNNIGVAQVESID